MSDLPEPTEVASPNIGAIFSDHLVSLKSMPFKGTKAKRETLGSFLTLIFMYLGICLVENAVRTRLFMDEAHLTSSGWLKKGILLSFGGGGECRSASAAVAPPEHYRLRGRCHQARVSPGPPASSRSYSDSPPTSRRPETQNSPSAGRGPTARLPCHVRDSHARSW